MGSKAKEGDKTESRLFLGFRIKLDNVARSMKAIFLKIWTFKNIFFFIGSVTAIHVFGDELAV